ncbi:arylsulfatase [Pedosphaera parvula]|uniref:Sulfatase n=1 Tax=Pedosphaera parvula (strain Ellin514) TaxID=320771 RepID=B9XAP1_PEDPL|nr:arylsulfatase [Pedosphaera parvula]EEF63076.1 sulfatase [Pedosphaera parvula Ellin514]
MSKKHLAGLFHVWRWILVFALLEQLSFKGLAAETSATPPNIVLILADDLGFSDLGCFGSEISTPHLDHLAAEGLRMTQFYTTPRCCPSRAALLTGLYPQQAGIGNMMEDRGIPGYRGELGQNCLTIAEELRRADYHTAMVGKWHLSHIHFDGKKQLNHESDEPFWDNKNSWPVQRGFEDYFGTIHGVGSYYDPFSLVRNNTPIRPEGTNFYYTHAITEHAVADINRLAGNKKPFFLFVAYTAPHWPLQAPEKDIAKYRQRYLAGWDTIRSNRYQRQMEMGLLNKKWPLSPRDPRVPAWSSVVDKEWEANRMATYAAMVENLDNGVGNILETLKRKGIEQNTLVIFFSDNGACAEPIEPNWYDVPSRTRDGRHISVGNNNHAVFAGPDNVWQSYGIPWANVSDTPFLLYKHFTHEGGIASPFIARWPAGIKQSGVVSDQLAHVTDIMPTLVEIASAAHPDNYEGRAIQPLEGKSLLPIFEGKDRLHPSPIFWEHEGNRAVRLQQWKLVARQGQEWELYDSSADRTEQNNLTSFHPDKVKEMANLYDAWAKRCHVLPFDQLPRERPIIPAQITNAAPQSAFNGH